MSASHVWLAHSASPGGHEDPLRDHLRDVAARASRYASAFGAAAEAEAAGLLHDLGKYGELFRQRLAGTARGVDHWSAGAWVAVSGWRQAGIRAALAIQGHHVGLQQGSEDALRRLQPKRLAQAHPLGLRLSEPDTDRLLCLAREDHVALPEGLLPATSYDLWRLDVAAMLDVRMLFSTLVDADYIETEAHFSSASRQTKQYRPSGPPLEPGAALDALEAHVGELARRSEATSQLNHVRAELLRESLAAAGQPPGLFTFTAPTGTGKTLAMLAFALRHAAVHGLRRVVVVIPYLTIIEQTAAAYRDALAAWIGQRPAGSCVVEDHSLAGTRPEGEAEVGDEGQSRLLAENWDAPIVVTTSVQFLQSLFAHRPRPCRKLHRLARSVVLFDEVQTLPLALAVPTLAALSHLAEGYGASVLFGTATQPAFARLDGAVRGQCAAGWQPREVVPARLELFARCRRTRVAWPTGEGGRLSWAELAERMVGVPQGLTIVNLKRHARELLAGLKRRGAEGAAHLSTSMCPAHRQAVLLQVRQRLAEGLPCRLVSTQCVEAGVDVDFPVVWRAWGPLDAITQAAGRCNRNGRQELGTVHVFEPEGAGDPYPDGAYRQAADVARRLLREHGADNMDIHDPALFDAYYRELYALRRLDESGSGELAEAMQCRDFPAVSAHYRLIPQDAINVLVAYEETTFDALAGEVRETGLTTGWVVRARPHSVGLFRPRPQDPVRDWLEPVRARDGEPSGDWFIYLNKEHYDQNLGLVPPTSLACLIA